MRKFIPAWTALMLALLFATIALAQDSGKLTGQILDKEGKPYPDVTVEIKNSETGQALTTKTGKDGKFTQLGLRGGNYLITLTNQKDNLAYGPVKFPIQAVGENDFSINFKQVIAETAAAHPEEVKKKEEEEDKFKNMKLHFTNGVTAINEATDLQKQIQAAAADQKAALREKRATDCQTAITEFVQAEQGIGPKDVNNHATVWQDLGASYECVGRYDDAVAAFQKSIDLKPQAATYSGLSTNLANVGAAMTDQKAAESKYAEATADCEKVMALDPAAGGTCYKNVGIILSNKGKQQDAVAPLQKAAQANPQDALTWFLLGSALSAKIEPKQEGEKMMYVIPPGTKEAYQKAADLAPNTPLAAQAKEALDGLEALSGGAETTVSKKKKKT